MDRTVAETLLKVAINNPEATFRSGQWEAIDALVNHRRRLMVVQRTGWGKSLVYFIGTRILRDRGAGPTLIISPLLSLMRNQLAAAQRLGICAQTINSSNQSDWPSIKALITSGQADAILVSPERLANESFVQEVLLPVAARIGLFVVDEAHCISDWGHDFRPDYRRLIRILQYLPPTIPLLCTTATANNRVIDDVSHLLGNIDIQRGPLARKSLVLQTLRLPHPAARLAWLAHYIPKLPGTGIVYTLTKDDADRVADWLNSCGIESRAYYSNIQHPDFDSPDAYRQHLEEQLLRNELKVLVATTALGMGYDKPDLGFVIHYQTPGSVISYYQQVGRAGRGINRAYGVLMAGKEDPDIHAFFRDNAFPASKIVRDILTALAESDELTASQLATRLNLPEKQIAQALKFLSTETRAPVIRDAGKWRRTPVAYQMDEVKIRRISQQRIIEWQEINAYLDSDTCLMNFLQKSLDDPDAEPCGRCAACRQKPIISDILDFQKVDAAKRFLSWSEISFYPRKQIPAGALSKYNLAGNIPVALAAREGRILSRWNDAVWGKMVSDGKKNGHFSDELVEAMAQMIEQRWRPTPQPQWLTCVPSQKHPELVPSFARRLAHRLNLPFQEVIRKARDNDPQKLQKSRYHQCHNLDGAFALSPTIPASPVFLVDDIIDSGWTMTLLAILLRQAGAGPVYPIALASTRSNG